MNASAILNRGLVVLRRNAPRILTWLGTTGVVAGCVWIGVESTKIPKIVEEHKKRKEETDKVVPVTEDNKKEHTKAIAKVYGKTSMEFAKIYAGPVAVEVASLACLLGANNILTKRNATILAAYSGLMETFKQYRERVSEDAGKEKDLEYRFGKKDEKKTETEGSEEGKATPVYDPSQFARFFDPASRYWSKTPEYNLMFLKSVQNEMNNLLKKRGYVFLNEVYEALDIPCSQVGHMVGWLKESEEGDGHIDFCIYDGSNERKRAFVNGDEGSILLDFNVDGVIYDKIKVWREV